MKYKKKPYHHFVLYSDCCEGPVRTQYVCQKCLEVCNAKRRKIRKKYETIQTP